jgi:hypothetical protein
LIQRAINSIHASTPQGRCHDICHLSVFAHKHSLSSTACRFRTAFTYSLDVTAIT